MKVEAGRSERLAGAAPPSRERFVDLLRAACILVVVLGHWLGALLWRRGGQVGADNVLEHAPWLSPVTWAFQIMPVFFLVGGFCNFLGYESRRRRGRGGRSFLRARAARLLAPAAVFLGAWLAVEALLHVAGSGGARLPRLGWLPFGPLWFLAVYLLVVAATPPMARLHRSYRGRVVAALVAAAAGVDLLRFGAGVEGAGMANLVIVWVLVHQLGFFYADGTLPAAPRRAHALLAAAGLGGLVLLTVPGPYPYSMTGNKADAFSNMFPPTLAIVALSFWLVGAVMLLRPAATRWLEHPRAWLAVAAANRVGMSVYLWHMTALVLAALLLWPLGFGRLQEAGPWWLERSIRIAASTLVLAGLVAVFLRFDPSRPRPGQAPPAPS